MGVAMYNFVKLEQGEYFLLIIVLFLKREAEETLAEALILILC